MNEGFEPQGSNRAEEADAALMPLADEWACVPEPLPISYMLPGGSEDSPEQMLFRDALFYLTHPLRVPVELPPEDVVPFMDAAMAAVIRWQNRLGAARYEHFVGVRRERVLTEADALEATVRRDPWRYYEFLERYVREELRARGVLE